MTEAQHYPAARRDDVVDHLHGEAVADPYRWLEDPDSPESKDWQREESELFEVARASWDEREAFRDRVTELLRTGTVGTPAWRGQLAFFVRREPDQEHGVLMLRGAEGSERVLVDPMVLDPDGTTTLDAWQPSKDGRFVAYQTSHGGTEDSVLSVMDVTSGDVIDGPIDRCRYSPVAWLPDSTAFYYVRQLPADEVPADEAQYHRRVWLHRLGSDVSGDVLVFGTDQDKTTFYGVSVSRDGRWLSLTAALGTAPRNDVWLADLSAGEPAAPVWVPVRVGVDARTSVWVGRDGRLYAFTDADAPRGKVMVGDPTRPDPAHWRPLIDQDDTAVLNDVALLDGDDLNAPVIAAAWTRHAVSELTLHDLATGARRGSIALPGLGTVAGLAERPEGGHETWFAYTDHVTPPTVFCYDATRDDVVVWAGPPGVAPDPQGIGVTQVTYDSYDGTHVRMFVIAKEPGAEQRARPTILYGYGGFGIALTPTYSASILAWVEAGGVYAIANLRGGSEEGEEWHRAGMRDRKQRVFDDFHAAAERLVADGLTRPDLLAVHGGSNGGLLVGAALTQRPDLYRAVVCSAPLLDMVRYEQRGLGRLWTDEFGSAGRADQLRWLLAYSPYHRVRPATAYPAVLFTVFASDSRVDPLHARKMCAALQAATSADPGTNPILLRSEVDAGHGARAVSRTVDLTADTLGFTAWATSLTLR
ncbi:MAG: prolyl oligopeptidase family serine peptidase [Nocardioidaceae bacterium]